MSEVTDLVMPVLQKIQQDMQDMRRGVEGRISGLSDKMDGLASRMDAFEGYFTYTMGLTSRNTADIEVVREEMKELRRQFAAVDPAP